MAVISVPIFTANSAVARFLGAATVLAAGFAARLLTVFCAFFETALFAGFAMATVHSLYEIPAA
jgi:hypothetical protein